MNITENHTLKLIPRAKAGINIKKSHRGLFKKYCNGHVTNECIQRGKNSLDPKIRKRAVFASNARHWKHQNGGSIEDFDNWYNNSLNTYFAKQQALNESETERKRKAENLSNIFGELTTLGWNLGTKLREDWKDNNINAYLNLGGNKDLARLVRQGIVSQEDAYKMVNPEGDMQFENGLAKDFSKVKLLTKANKLYQKNNQINSLLSQVSKKGGLIKKNNKPFGHISVLDDTGKVDPKTLKLKK